MSEVGMKRDGTLGLMASGIHEVCLKMGICDLHKTTNETYQWIRFLKCTTPSYVVKFRSLALAPPSQTTAVVKLLLFALCKYLLHHNTLGRRNLRTLTRQLDHRKAFIFGDLPCLAVPARHF